MSGSSKPACRLKGKVCAEPGGFMEGSSVVMSVKCLLVWRTREAVVEAMTGAPGVCPPLSTPPDLSVCWWDCSR